jgi:DUF1680 family protein
MSRWIEAAPVHYRKVKITDEFWGPRMALNRTVSLRHQYDQLRQQGCVDAFKWKPGLDADRERFRDSDMARWIEAAAYALALHPDPELESWIDAYVGTLAPAQHPDGYINSYCGLVHPELKYVNLSDHRELCQMGHMIEAAVAYFEATGKRAFLDIMIACANGIEASFGTGGNMRDSGNFASALVRLYRVTDDQRYLKQAERMVHECDRESLLPEGPAARVLGLYSGMADVALAAGDRGLRETCNRLWRAATTQFMYITGALGTTADGERFAFSYDLPNETACTETCGAIGLASWAHRMLQADPDGRYGDILERALYNGVLSGVSQSGDHYSACNPTSIYPGTDPQGQPRSRDYHHHRTAWMPAPCCPTNLARVLASIGGYAYGQASAAAWIHMYIDGTAELSVCGQPVSLRVETRYPWEGRVRIKVQPSCEMGFDLHLRIPGWCRNPMLRINGTSIHIKTKRGYAVIARTWRAGDRVELDLPMEIRFVSAHPAVWANGQRVAVERGPMVYAFEEVDNGPYLADLMIRKSTLKADFEPGLFGGIVSLVGRGEASDPAVWKDKLYDDEPALRVARRVKAVPFCLWGNRGAGNMAVWVTARG